MCHVVAEAYSAMYNTDAYQLPESRGVAESYVKYQMYTNPPGYSAHMGQYGGYDDGGVSARNRMYSSTASAICKCHN